MFIDFITRIENENLHLAGIAVQQHGKFLGEHRWLADVPHLLFSLSKSFTSSAVGMAVDEGLLHLSDRLSDFFPDLVETLPDPTLRNMTLRDILIMSSGHDRAYLSVDQREYIMDPDWPHFFLSQPIPYQPGTYFYYDTGCTYAAGAMVSKVSGQKLVDFLMPRLFTPFGIERPVWEECPMGRNIGGSGLYLRTKDLLKFGQMYLQKGIWEGKQLLSEQWIKEATNFQIPSHDCGSTLPHPDWECGYGYQFWLNRNGTYRADGMNSQFCIIDEELDAVIAVTANEPKSQDVLNAIWDTVRPKLAFTF